MPSRRPARRPGTLHVLTRPGMLLLHGVAVLAVVAAVLLGRWQVGAWQMHREDRAAEIADDEPVPLGTVIGADDAFPADGVGRPVSVSGTWQPDDTVLVSGKEHDGANGFWSVTLLRVCDAGCASLPVVLGWSPDEASAASANLPPGDVELSGWLQPGESAGPPDDDPADAVLPTLRVASLLQRVEGDLYGGYLILRTPAGARGDLAAVTPESLPDPPTFTALRNLLYGIEWWLFGLFAAFLWWRWSRDELDRWRDRVTPLSEPVADGREDPVERIPSTS
jgi:surfeit locus 1 family protein